MPSNDGVELRIKSSVDDTLTTLDKIKQKLELAGIQVDSMSKSMKDQTQYIVKAHEGWTKYNFKVDETGNILKDTIKETKNYSEEIKEQASAAKQAAKEQAEYTNNMNIAITTIAVRAQMGFRALKQVVTQLKNCITEAIDFNETVNKFNVSMGTSASKATEFQNKLSEAFGTSKAEMMDYQASFKNIMSTTGNLSDETAEKISESLVKMGLDYASLYNVDQASAMEKYQGALTGSIRPIRNGAGYDVSKNAVVAKANELGVDRTYTNLSEMEKRLLRIITLMDQMKNTGAMQDFARTIEEPANQLKVMKNQLQEIQVWIGNAFIGTLGKALPYINGFLMAIKELVKSFAFFVGYQENDSANLSDVFESAETSSSGLSSNLGGAAKSAKEIRKQLLGFDVLNVINTPTTTSSSSGSSTGGDFIDPKILSALSEYDNMMDSVRMKATEIRDKILDWLGATDGSYKNLKLLLGIIGGILGTLTLINTVGAIKNLIRMLQGGTPIASKFASAFVKIGTGVKDVTTATKGTTTALGSLGTILKSILKVASTIGGIVLSVKGLKNLSDAYNDTLETGNDNTKKVVKSGLELAGAGALIGSNFGIVGAAIGTLVGACVFGQASLKQYQEAIESMAEKDLFGSLTISTDEWSDSLSNLDSNVSEFSSKLSTYTNSMKTYYDNFSQAEDTIDSFATKFSIASYKISNEDITSMENAISEFSTNAMSTVDTTTTRMIDLWSETYKSNDDTIDEGERSMFDKIYQYGEDQKTTIKNAQDTITKTYKNGINSRGYLTEEERKTIEKSLEEINNLVKDNMTTSEANMQYYVDQTKNKTSQAGADVLNITQESYENFLSAQEQYLKEAEEARSQKYVEQLNNLNTMLRNEKISNEEYHSALNALNEERAQNEEETQNKVRDYRDQMFEGLYRKYIELEGKTDAVSQSERDKLETMFANANIDTSYVESQAWNKGEKIGTIVSSQIQANAKVNLSDSITYNETDLKNTANKIGTIIKNGVETKMHFGFNIDDNGKVHWSWKNYATGGLPETGQMFVAREAGPELVGQIGNQTAVVNNQQIVQAVSQGVANAVSSVMKGYSSNGGSYNLYLDGEQLRASVTARQERYNMMTGK